VVNRSARHIHVQLVDDLSGTTLAPPLRSRPTCVRSTATKGPQRAGRTAHRGARRPQGSTRLCSTAVATPTATHRALADAAREGGLKF